MVCLCPDELSTLPRLIHHTYTKCGEREEKEEESTSAEPNCDECGFLAPGYISLAGGGIVIRPAGRAGHLWTGTVRRTSVNRPTGLRAHINPGCLLDEMRRQRR